MLPGKRTYHALRELCTCTLQEACTTAMKEGVHDQFFHITTPDALWWNCPTHSVKPFANPVSASNHQPRELCLVVMEVSHSESSQPQLATFFLRHAEQLNKVISNCLPHIYSRCLTRERVSVKETSLRMNVNFKSLPTFSIEEVLVSGQSTNLPIIWVHIFKGREGILASSFQNFPSCCAHT